MSATTDSPAPRRASTAAGTFTDPGADSFSATVDYGDGSTPGVLATTGGAFALSHAFRTAGTRTITVQVCDDDQGCTTSTATVLVENPVPATSPLMWSPSNSRSAPLALDGST